MEQMKKMLVQANDLMKEEHFDEALELLNTLDSESELGGVIDYMKGCSFLQLEQDEQAHLCFGAALDKGFVRKELYINFAIVKTRMGKYLQAEQLFRQAADLEALAQTLEPGSSVELALYRSGSQISVTLVWNEIQ